MIAVAPSHTNPNPYTFNTNLRFNCAPNVPLFLANPNSKCINPNVNQLILNPAAWIDTPAGTWGQGAAYYNDYRWQHRVGESMNVERTFQFCQGMALSVSPLPNRLPCGSAAELHPAGHC